MVSRHENTIWENMFGHPTSKSKTPFSCFFWDEQISSHSFSNPTFFFGVLPESCDATQRLYIYIYVYLIICLHEW